MREWYADIINSEFPTKEFLREVSKALFGRAKKGSAGNSLGAEGPGEVLRGSPVVRNRTGTV